MQTIMDYSLHEVITPKKYYGVFSCNSYARFTGVEFFDFIFKEYLDNIDYNDNSNMQGLFDEI